MLIKKGINHSRKVILIFLIVQIQSVVSFSQTIKTLNVNTAGTLSTLINETEQKTVTTLTLSGNIDARDFVFMRDKLRVLSSADLTSANIKAYTGTDGTNTGLLTTYSINEIPAYAFYNPVYNTFKYTLTSFKLPSTTTSIGYLAFYYCTMLSGTVTIPASVKSIGEYAFYGCTQISSFSVANNNSRYSSLNGVLFNKNQDTLFIFPGAKSGTYTIPASVKHVGASAFEGQSNLMQLYFPSTLNSIGAYAFAFCNGVSGNLTLPSNLKKIEDGAFYGCSKLNGTVIIPAGLTDFGNYCFFECNNISSFSVSASNTAYA
ncbi:MAG: leucine-rich repeat domain-containing protein, partial [Candidatus Methanofastidiosa archaeon]|nr:leucine-rich repeat domain-containing protein [Candidatus Methanofastidiosa archaeon]